MKKVYTKPELEFIDLSAKELLMGIEIPGATDGGYGFSIDGSETDVSLPQGWI